jgi:hypothetical protein
MMMRAVFLHDSVPHRLTAMVTREQGLIQDTFCPLALCFVLPLLQGAARLGNSPPGLHAQHTMACITLQQYVQNTSQGTAAHPRDVHTCTITHVTVL